MFCPKCGTRLPDEAAFCTNCGAQLAAFRPAAPAPQEPVQDIITPQYTPQDTPPYMQQETPPQYGQQAVPPQYDQPQQQLRPVQPGVQSSGSAPAPKGDGSGLLIKILLGVAAVLLIAVAVVAVLALRKPKATSENASASEQTEASSESATPEIGTLQPEPSGDGGSSSEDAPGGTLTDKTDTVDALIRPSLFAFLGSYSDRVAVIPSVPFYTVNPDLSNVTNLDDFYFSDPAKQMLAKNGFVVLEGSGGSEFFSVYETNRYWKNPNFVTVDSMMHAYHLYFSHLMKTTEKNYLVYHLLTLSNQMMEKSEAQRAALAGTEWEEAAKRNVAFFAVGARLLDDSVTVPSSVTDIVSDELSKISAQAGIGNCLITGEMEDYSQYIVRGYYAGDPQLERYFRAMMWYGRIGFRQSMEDLDRSALLMTLALDGDTKSYWEAIYAVTAFFAGESDDCGYYEYRPVIDAAYGADVTVADLPGNTEAFNEYHRLTATMRPPCINSIPVYDDPDTDSVEASLGYRFMGQRFSLDATIFQNLIYGKVKENSMGNKRMLPDALDIPAAFGSEAALMILQERGATDFAKYVENMTELRTEIANAPDTLWNASLYSRWLFTLQPLVYEKGDGYPAFMQGNAWARKSLSSFLGSYTELKHDTVLYSKQTYAEMGGDLPPEEKDDRGYVEPEPEVFKRLATLTDATSAGLSAYGLISDADKDNLMILRQLANSFAEIAEKELKNELPTDGEFELIRSYGGQLQHLWEEAMKADAEATGQALTTKAFPAAVVTDVATDPDGGVCLELGTGSVSEICVIFPIGGELHVASGTCFSFYQFSQPISDRLTDNAWREMMGLALNSSGSYNTPAKKTEDWVKDFSYNWRDYN